MCEKNTISAKCNKVKHNKMKCDCISCDFVGQEFRQLLVVPSDVDGGYMYSAVRWAGLNGLK